MDAHTGPALREELLRLTEAGSRWLLLDMTAVQYMDSVGLGILVGATKRVAERQGALALIGPRPNVRRVLEISGTTELLNLVASLQEAYTRLHLPGDAAPSDGEEC